MHQPSREARLPESAKSGCSPQRSQPIENNTLTKDRNMVGVSFLWLEITGKCQLECVHCYAESSLSSTHGVLDRSDWEQILDQARYLGVKMVQFIGGEPTLHPDLAALINYALRQGLLVEVFSNLVHVSPNLWEVFNQPGVKLATSYYTDNPREHESITQRRGSYSRTKINIIEAVRRSIPIRVGIVKVHDEQHIQQAHRELEALGVQEIRVDRLRQVGRGTRDQQPGISQLCGNCGGDFIAIFPNGTVSACPISRWITIGDIRKETLSSIVGSQKLAEIRKGIRSASRNGYSVHISDKETDDCDPWKGACGP